MSSYCAAGIFRSWHLCTIENGRENDGIIFWEDPHFQCCCLFHCVWKKVDNSCCLYVLLHRDWEINRLADIWIFWPFKPLAVLKKACALHGYAFFSTLPATIGGCSRLWGSKNRLTLLPSEHNILGLARIFLQKEAGC